MRIRFVKAPEDVSREGWSEKRREDGRKGKEWTMEE